MAIENEGSEGLIKTSVSPTSASNPNSILSRNNTQQEQAQQKTKPPPQVVLSTSVSVAEAIASFNGNRNLSDNSVANISNISNSHNNSNTNNSTGSNGITNLKTEIGSSLSGNGSIKKSMSTSKSSNNVQDEINSLDGSSTNSQSSANNNSNIKTTNAGKCQIDYYNAPIIRHHNDIVNDDDDGLGPLPSKWEKAFTEHDELYFIDHNTGTSHWLDPRLSKFQKKSLEDCLDDELPYGWERIDDPVYGIYFIDHVNRRTQYENPVLEAKRCAEQNRLKNRSPPSPSRHNERNSNANQKSTLLPYTFTRNPSEMRGERVSTTLLKSSRGLGITIVGGDDGVDEFLQIKSIVPNGPAWLDGKLLTGDILVYVNDVCVLGFTHHEMVNVFQSILPGETATIEVCRGYPLPFDPNDPNTEVITTIAVDGINSDDPNEKSRLLMDLNMDGNYNFISLNGAVGGISLAQKNPLAKIHSGSLAMAASDNYDDLYNLKTPEILEIEIVKGKNFGPKGIMGFGFTIADSAYGQKVKKILDRNCCKNLQEGDILLEINNIKVKNMTHGEVVQVLKDCPKIKFTKLTVQRNINGLSNRYTNTSSSLAGINAAANGMGSENIKESSSKYSKSSIKDSTMFRSKTPTADLYSTQAKEILPIRPKTPLVDTRSRARVKTPSNELNEEVEAVTSGLLVEQHQKSIDTKSQISLHDEIDSINNDIPFMDPYPKMVTSLTERLAEAQMLNEQQQQNIYTNPIDIHSRYDTNSLSHEYSTYGGSNQFNPSSGTFYPSTISAIPLPTYHPEPCYCFECRDYNRYLLDYQQQIPSVPHVLNVSNKAYDFMVDKRSSGLNTLNHLPHNGMHQAYMGKYNNHSMPSNLMQPIGEDEYILSEVTLEKQTLGFGFRVVGGTEEGSQVAVGHIVPGGSADGDPRIETGDEIISVDGINVINSSHHKVVSLMSEASALRSQVTMILRRRVGRQYNNNSSKVIQPSTSSACGSLIRSNRFPYDVIVSRKDNESFGFVIISSANQFYGSTIGKLIPNSPAERCDKLKIGDRIIAVNRIDIAGMSHTEVVNLIKNSGLHVRLTIGCPQDIGQLHQHLEQNRGEYFEGSQLTQHPQL